MARILVLFATRNGHTPKVAEALAEELKRLGDEPSVVDVATHAASREILTHDAVVLGAPVYRGRYPKGVYSFVKRNRSELRRKPGAFFSVCLGVLEAENEHALRREQEIVDEFSHETDWHPRVTSIFGGALSYTQYSLPVRLLMRLIAGRAGGSTDTSRDHDYTDWEQVRRFAREFSALIARPRPRRVA